MSVKRPMAMDAVRVKSLIWALPAAFIVLLVEYSFHNGLFIPVPFLSMFVGVALAGAIGGLGAGSLAAIMASAFIIHAHMLAFGPVSLTGSVTSTGLGVSLFVLLGVLLGRLKDQRDDALRELQKQREQLRNSLLTETAEKLKHAANVLSSDLRLENAVRIAGIGHYSFSAETSKCLFCSEQHAAHFGMTPEEFSTVTDGTTPRFQYVHEDDRALVLAAVGNVDNGNSQVFEYRAFRPDGEMRYIREMEEPVLDQFGNHIESVGTSIDMTDLRKAEARLRQSQKIEALGTLTGGVAHDFNNLSAIILGNLELALEQGPTDDWEDLVNEAVTATKRGAALTKNLLSFSRRAHLEPTVLNLNQVVQTTMTWARRVLPATIAIENSFMAGLWDVELDLSSAENAVINILLNARDAMPEGGRITIETANMRIGDDYVAERNEDIEPGRYVMLAISDTGKGIKFEDFDSIFEPFYTDKPVGKGSGLGLSMVHGFMKQSGGTIRVYSELGVGTTFKLYFKALARSTADIVPAQVIQTLPSSGRAEVLLAEDEIGVMIVVRRILEGAGYSVTAASSGDEALQIFKGSDHFDVLLTDVVMPGQLQGPGLAKEIRKLRPTFPCIFMSGYAAEATVHGNGLLPSDIRLMKPVGRADLLQAVAKALAHNRKA